MKADAFEDLLGTYWQAYKMQALAVMRATILPRTSMTRDARMAGDTELSASA